jgi:FlaA1/EpsC-like NDP-sugar epimerase
MESKLQRLWYTIGVNTNPGVAIEKQDAPQTKRKLYCDDYKFCESFSGKNILITGASGAVGSILTKLLMTQSKEMPNLYLFVRDGDNIYDEDIKY